MHVGQRVSLAGFHGTIRYIGSLGDSIDVWIGLEWDDPSRGKHSGTFKNEKIFSCRDGHGSFLRQSKISFDATQSFMQAVENKYVDRPSNMSNEVTIVPGFTKPMQAIGFDKVKQHYKDITNASELFLASSSIDSLGLHDISDAKFDNLVTLGLSWNLLSNFEEIVDFCRGLPKLKVLKLEGNRFHFTSSSGQALEASTTITDLSLNITYVTWTQITLILQTWFPEVFILHLALNELDDDLNADDSRLSELDLHGNKITNIHSVLSCFSGLEQLNLSNNLIRSISKLEHETKSKVKHINLANNPMEDLSELRNLSCYKSLQSLSYTLTFDDKVDERSRLLLIQYLPQLETVNRTKITQQERADAARLGETRDSTSHTMSENFCLLTFILGDVRIKKKVLRTQSVKQLKATFARFAKVRPAKIASLVCRVQGSEILLDDDLAQLSYYGITTEGEILAIIE